MTRSCSFTRTAWTPQQLSTPGASTSSARLRATVTMLCGVMRNTATPSPKQAQPTDIACQNSPVKSAMITPNILRGRRLTARWRGPPKPTRYQCNPKTFEQSLPRYQPRALARRSGWLAACESSVVWPACLAAVAAHHRSFCCLLACLTICTPQIVHRTRVNPNHGNRIAQYHGPPMPVPGVGDPPPLSTIVSLACL